MKIYIAGKISGDENYREKFRKQEERLREEGHIVLNPAADVAPVVHKKRCTTYRKNGCYFVREGG